MSHLDLPNEAQLRALSRREIQALAKKEKIKPLNASSKVLIKRLLEKFCPSAKRESTPKLPVAGTSSIPLGQPTEQRRSARLSTSDPVAGTQASSAGTTTLRAGVQATAGCVPVQTLRTTDLSQSKAATAERVILSVPTHVEGSSQSSAPLNIDTRSVPETDPSQTPIPAVVASPTFQFAVFEEEVPPAPSKKAVRYIQASVYTDKRRLARVPDKLAAMSAVLAHLEAAPSVRDAAHELAWDRFYLERVIVSRMKLEHTLWDGTRVMPQGPQQEAWLSFLDECSRVPAQDMADDLDGGDTAAVPSNASTLTVNSVSTTSQKRQRETDNDIMDETKPSKRRKDKESLL